ncbi:MAG: hypothetical protein IT384_22270 [Deltaproteobacteria bacterium]|nr:hypothetical protein [Deltaproteobacteria bacterium]
MEPESGSLKERFVVRSYDLDLFGRASPRALSSFLQDAAGLHAVALGVGPAVLIPKGIAWALQRFRLEIDEPPRLHEEIIVETWPSELERLYAHRDWQVTALDGRVLARATSAWVIFDLATRRARRVQDELGHVPVVFRPRLVALEKRKPRAVSAPEHTRRFRVRLCDLDVNAHTNNTRYLEWIIESVASPIWRSHRLAGIEMLFRAESVYDEVVTASSQRTGGTDEEPTFVHSIVRERDQTELVRAETRWITAEVPALPADALAAIP